MKKLLLLLLILCAGKPVLAHERDSLLQQLALPNDTSRIDALVALSHWYSKENPDSALLLARQALTAADKWGKTNRQAKAHAVLGLQLKRQKSFKEANIHYNLAMLGFHKTGEPARKAAMLANMGIVYRNTGQYDSALYMHLQALAIREKLGTASETANSQICIAQLYYDLEDFKQALSYQEAALALYQQAGDESHAASVSSDMGLVYYKTSQYTLALKSFALAENSYRKLNDDEGLAYVYNNQAMVYQKLEQFDKAISLYEASLAIKIKLEDERGSIHTLYNIGNSYYDQQNFPAAIRFLKKAEEKALTEDHKTALIEIYDILALSYEEQGNYKRALFYRTAFSTLSESLLNETKTEQMAEMQTRYETEKTERALENQTALVALEASKASKNELQRNLLAVILLLALFLAWLAYGRIKFKQQLALEKLKRDQQEMAHRAILETEEKERIRISRELHDGVGQQMAALKLNLGLLSDQLQLEGMQKEKMLDLVALANDASKEVRSVSHSLMPNALLRAGLATAAREFLQQLANERIKIDFEVVGLNDRLSHTQELALFRVLQECMSNILKHAEASIVSIQLIRHADEVNMLIEDNGKGFTVAEKMNAGGLGLQNMINRLAELGGEVDFDSFPGRGTIVNVHLKL